MADLSMSHELTTRRRPSRKDRSGQRRAPLTRRNCSTVTGPASLSLAVERPSEVLSLRDSPRPASSWHRCALGTSSGTSLIRDVGHSAPPPISDDVAARAGITWRGLYRRSRSRADRHAGEDRDVRRCSTCVTHCADTDRTPASCSSESSTRGSTTTESEHPSCAAWSSDPGVVDHSLALCASTVSAGRCIGPRTFRKLKASTHRRGPTAGRDRTNGASPCLDRRRPDAVGWTTAGCSTRFTASFGPPPKRRERAVLNFRRCELGDVDKSLASMLACLHAANMPNIVSEPPRRCPWRTPTSGGAAGPVAPGT